MSMYKIEWSCGDTSITESYAPEECPFCKLANLQALVAKAGLVDQVVVDCEPIED